MATTSPDNIWTPDAGDDYALTTDLAAMADTIQDAISDVRDGVPETPLIQHGSISFVGNSTSSVERSVTFPTAFGAGPVTVQVGSWVLAAGNTLVTGVVSQNSTGFTARMAQTGVNPGFGATYTVRWTAVGPRP